MTKFKNIKLLKSIISIQIKYIKKINMYCRATPAHVALQTEVIKMICKKDGVKYPQGMKKLF